MKKSSILPALLLGITIGSCAQSNPAPVPSQTVEKEKVMQKEGLKTATLAAGCFWCVEAIFQDVKGVHKVASGYTAGHVKNPSYREVCNGTTGHTEALRIEFDPAVVSFEDLVKIFFATHDPTTLNRQGADAGTQYRSGIYYHDEEQKAIAERLKKDFAPTLWDDPIVTEILPASEFYVAEDYHQNYYKDNTSQPYCRAVITPKVQKFRKMFADKLKS